MRTRNAVSSVWLLVGFRTRVRHSTWMVTDALIEMVALWMACRRVSGPRQHPWSVDVRDSSGRKRTDPGYDPSTVYVPSDAERRMTPFQQQFWAIKRHHYNTVLLFKKGKFYECYDVDADIGHQVLQLNYTGSGRADMRCVGVPESAFFRHAIRLVDAGYRVGRVEQVETVLAAKNNANKICDRRLVKILTKSTIVDESGEDVFGDPRYLMTIVEDKWARGSGTTGLGVCYLNVATAAVHFGVLLTDDERFTKLETLLVRVRPQEVLLDSSSERLEFLVRSCAASDVQVHRRSLAAVFSETFAHGCGFEYLHGSACAARPSRSC
ncbi:Component of the post-replicative DNA mismatch repair system (MMR) [Cyanidiococcus yangmingshanensis]|uniref:Component of the post-replicative DNA mismatch repair system (MMR) n=1 Tax=Cyanidiococcus yangmingshanensis TaxID=2690220 RepID=A0A7J7IGV4_9RHOD|nr:Component of the post-replicative DNA mismatch repair system (MMR) [Cyanidiococcus yangmingshanensis]